MSNKEIRAGAMKHLERKWGTAVALTVFKIAFLLAYITGELLIYAIFSKLDVEYSFKPAFVFGTDLGRFMLVIRGLIVVFVIMPERFILRRLFIDLFSGRNFIETRQFIQHASRTIHPRMTAASALPAMLKLFMSMPLIIGIYGIYYWGWVRSSEKLTTLGLFAFMLCIGFSIVWSGVLVYYSISLKLTKYIMALNPRANIFDACDLSARLMDGQHMRYIIFILSFLKYIPLLVLFYPIFIFDPFYKMSEAMLAQDIMGDYWQDKLPAMIHRWNKYAG